MTVYVDPLFPTPPAMRKPGSGWRWPEACHLFADSLDELNIFAKKMGLQGGWLQHHDRVPHYDLTKARRVRAVALGAMEVSRHELGERLLGRSWSQ